MWREGCGHFPSFLMGAAGVRAPQVHWDFSRALTGADGPRRGLGVLSFSS